MFRVVYASGSLQKEYPRRACVGEPPQGSPRSWKGEGALSFLSMTLAPSNSRVAKVSAGGSGRELRPGARGLSNSPSWSRASSSKRPPAGGAVRFPSRQRALYYIREERSQWQLAAHAILNQAPGRTRGPTDAAAEPPDPAPYPRQPQYRGKKVTKQTEELNSRGRAESNGVQIARPPSPRGALRPR